MDWVGEVSQVGKLRQRLRLDSVSEAIDKAFDWLTAAEPECLRHGQTKLQEQFFLFNLLLFLIKYLFS